LNFNSEDLFSYNINMIITRMEYKESNHWDYKYRTDVKDIFKLFSIPRMEYYSRGDTGFWDLTNSHNINGILLTQIRKNILYVLNTYFDNHNTEVKHILEKSLTDYVRNEKCISISFYSKSNQPIGIVISDTFIEGKKIATIIKDKSQDHAFGKPDMELFDWLYGSYIEGNTNLYGDHSMKLTISIKNNKNYVDYSVKSNDYIRSELPDVKSDESFKHRLMNKLHI